MTSKKIGMDIGGSLIKLAFEEKGSIRFKKYPVSELANVLQWLKIIGINKIALTGGRAGGVKEKFFPAAKIIHEFEENYLGVNWLLQQNNLFGFEKYLLVNIGTGTSWYKVEDNHCKRMLGSGIGGGTLMGLGSYLTKVEDFCSLMELASLGNRKNVDMLVKDIYTIEDPRINGELTASNFANLAEGAKKEDITNALLQMIGETLFLLTKQVAKRESLQKVVYIGGTISENPLLQTILTSFQDQLEVAPYFLENGEYCGAIAAYLSI
ncbi:type II pantothenate kinase [Niallia nealsonii]|uniref:Type II pantothenate kinase n=1 Tax=Niallia nealsonii TaxID=115979 RepID=A0A2N0Z3G3_9BACI|nr:type II pantothenate kinase [Niallia nealsonii]PKG24052.1 type II pantothenate kinase [Niallia nealsonii]